MNFIVFLSNTMIPLVIFAIVAYGILQKVSIFDVFVEGAKDGFLTVYKILPTLIGLMVGVGILRQSGALEALANLMAPLTEVFRFPGELLPLVIV